MMVFEPQNPRDAAAMKMMREWDHNLDPDRPEPLIFASWLQAMNKRLFQSRLGALYGRSWSPSMRVTLSVLRDSQFWCKPSGCPALIEQAFGEALDDLTAQYGGRIESWRWGNAHQAKFDHPLFSRIPLLRNLFDRHPPTGGAADTINVGAYRGTGKDAPFANTHGPGLRAIYDLSDLDKSTFQLAMGQSAHILSPHYDDGLTGWRRFEGFRIAGNAEGDVLVLKP
jgi:penicillin amidase